MRFYDLLPPVFLALFFFCVLPACGMVWTRSLWRRFRNRFFFMKKCRQLDYAAYRGNSGGVYHHIGVFDSFTSEKKISVKNNALNININLQDADVYLLLAGRENEKLNLNKLPILTRGLEVFSGGCLAEVDGELCLSSCNNEKLLVIFFEKGITPLEELICASGRGSNFYWNTLSRYSFAAGSFLLILYALQFLYRPAYYFVLVASIAFILLPFLTLLPPGLLLTMVSRRLFFESMRARIKKDLADYTSETGGTPSKNGAYLEILSWIFLAASEALNIFFIILAMFTLLSRI